MLTCKSHTAYCKGLFCCVVIFCFHVVLYSGIIYLWTCYFIKDKYLMFTNRNLGLVLLDYFLIINIIIIIISNAHLQSHVSRWQVSYGAERTPKPPPKKKKAQGCQERLCQIPPCVTEIRKKRLNIETGNSLLRLSQGVSEMVFGFWFAAGTIYYIAPYSSRKQPDTCPVVAIEIKTLYFVYLNFLYLCLIYRWVPLFSFI